MSLSQILTFFIWWRHTSFFICFSMRHSHVFIFCVIFFKLISYVLQLIALYGIANQRFQFISSIQNGRLKNGKPLKPKFVQIQKQNINSYRFEVADYEYCQIKIVCCVVGRFAKYRYYASWIRCLIWIYSKDELFAINLQKKWDKSVKKWWN